MRNSWWSDADYSCLSQMEDNPGAGGFDDWNKHEIVLQRFKAL